MPDFVGHCSTLGYSVSARWASSLIAKEFLDLQFTDFSVCYSTYKSTSEWYILVPQSLAQIIVHLVFSTKNREPLLPDSIRPDLHSHLNGTIANIKGVLLEAGSVEDHIHLLLLHPRTCSPADVVQSVKTSSSLWLKQQASTFNNFHWQNGYGMFSISPGHRQIVENYIRNQAEHHRSDSFQNEFRRLLQKYEVPYDERYVWD